MPMLSHSADTTIYLYFDNSSISTSQENKTGVWDSHFKGVYHLGDGSALSVADSTSNSNNGTNHGAVATTGQIDGGASFSGSGQYITASSFNLGTTTLTVSAWVYSTNFAQFGMVVEESPINSTWAFFFETNPPAGLKLRGGNTGSDVTITAPSNSAWHKITGIITGTTGTILIDGVQVATGTVVAIPSGTNTLNIGCYDSGAGYLFTGTIDEVRISNTARSNGWDTTEYNNQNSPSTFYSEGSAVSYAGAASGLIAQTRSQVTIGAKPGSTANSFPGLIDEPALYKAALSAARIQAHYQQGLNAAFYGTGIYGTSTYV